MTQEEEESDVKFLKTWDHRRPKMNVALLQAKDLSRNEKSTVFTCGANLHPRQIHGSLNVNQGSAPKPKTFRDCQTQTTYRRAIQNTQTELTGNLISSKFVGAQSDSNRVDCMTQIGWIKAQKAQQVDASIISAAMEVAESTPSSTSTGPAKDTIAHCETATPRVKKQDSISQISDSRALTSSGNIAPNRKLGKFEADAHSIDSEAFEAHVATGRLDFEARKESRDIITQIHSARETSNFGSQYDLGYRKMEPIKTKYQPKQKESEIQVSSSGLRTGSVELTRTLSNTNLQTKVDMTSVDMGTTPHTLKSFDAETQISHAPNISMAYDGIKSRKYASQQNLVQGDFKELVEGTSHCELNANGQTLSEMNVRSVSFPKRTEDHSTAAPKIAAGAEVQTAVTKLQHGVLEHSSNSPSEPTYLATCAAKRVCSDASCQVGTILQPETMEISTVPLKLTEIDQSMHRDGTLNAVICPTRVLVKPVLTEDSGINVAKMRDMQHLNVKIADRMYDASVTQTSRVRTQQDADHDERQICTLEMSSKNRQVDNYTMTALPSVAEAGITITLKGQRRQQNTVNQLSVCPTCHCQLETSYMSSAITEASTSRRPWSAVSKSTQVGTVLTPTRVQVLGVGAKPESPPEISKFSVGVQNILCPSTVELISSLTETGGIKVKDVSEVNAIKILAEGSTFHANAQNRVRQGNVAHSKGDLVHNRTASIAKKSEIYSVSDQSLMQQVRFEITSTKMSELCDFCHGTGQKVSAQVSSQDRRATSTNSATYRPLGNQKIQDSEVLSVECHQRVSTPVSRNVKCQVGIVLRPSSIEVGNISVKPRDRKVAEYLGMNVDSVLCPAKVQMIPEIGEAPGIEIINVTDVAHMEFQAGGIVVDANVQTHKPQLSSTATGTDKKPRPLLNIKSSGNGLTIGPSSSHASKQDTATVCDSFTLNDIGCEVVLRNSSIGGVCASCKGSGRTASVSVRATPKVLGTQSVETAHQYSELVPALMMTKPVLSVAKSCQVGTVLTPTCVNVAGVEMHPKNTTSAVSSGTIVYPAAVEVESRLVETSGIQIREVATMDSINFRLGEKSCIASTEMTPKSKVESCVLEVRSFHPEAVRGELSTHRMAVGSHVSTGKFRLQSIGCEFRLSDVTSSAPNYPHSLAGTFEPKTPEGDGLKSTTVSKRTDVSCQVGLTLVPTNVQVADIALSASDQRVVTNLGLKADAIICPSTVELETRLTETAGVTVTDVKDVKEVVITVGDRKGIVDVTGRNVRVQEMGTESKSVEPVYLSLTSRPPTRVQDTHSQFGKARETMTTQVNKPIDQNCRCTFRIRQMGESPNLRPVLSTQVEPSQGNVRKADTSCQVGVTMVPRKMNVSAVKVVVEEKSDADVMGISGPSVLQPTTCELESRISEKSGIAIAQMDAVEQIQLQIGGETYNASVVGGSVKPKATGTTGSWGSKHTPISITGYPRTVIHVPPSIQWSDADLCNATGPYLVTMKESTVQKKSILEVGALTLGGKRLQLSVDDDLRGRLTMQTTPQPSSSGQKPTSYPDSSQRLRSPIGLGDRLLPRRPNSQLCDVACEALIKPETLEKRLQTVFT